MPSFIAELKNLVERFCLDEGDGLRLHPYYLEQASDCLRVIYQLALMGGEDGFAYVSEHLLRDLLPWLSEGVTERVIENKMQIQALYNDMKEIHEARIRRIHVICRKAEFVNVSLVPMLAELEQQCQEAIDSQPETCSMVKFQINVLNEYMVMYGKIYEDFCRNQPVLLRRGAELSDDCAEIRMQSKGKGCFQPLMPFSKQQVLSEVRDMVSNQIARLEPYKEMQANFIGMVNDFWPNTIVMVITEMRADLRLLTKKLLHDRPEFVYEKGLIERLYREHDLWSSLTDPSLRMTEEAPLSVTSVFPG